MSQYHLCQTVINPRDHLKFKKCSCCKLCAPSLLSFPKCYDIAIVMICTLVISKSNSFPYLSTSGWRSWVWPSPQDSQSTPSGQASPQTTLKSRFSQNLKFSVRVKAITEPQPLAQVPHNPPWPRKDVLSSCQRTLTWTSSAFHPVYSAQLSR